MAQPLLASATRDHEQAQARNLANQAIMHNFPPSPELRPFLGLIPTPILPRPPASNSTAGHPSHHAPLFGLCYSYLQNRHTAPAATEQLRVTDGMKVGEVKENIPPIDVRTVIVHWPIRGHELYDW